MKRSHALLITCLIIFLIAVFVSPGLARPLPAEEEPSEGGVIYAEQAVYPGNYCVGCHTADDERLTNLAAWDGGIQRNEVSGCAAAQSIREELYYTERLMLAIERLHGELPASDALEKTDARLESAYQSYSRLLDEPVDSLEAFTASALALRYRLGKQYTVLNQVHEAVKQRNVLFAAGFVTLAVVGSLGWGLANTQKFVQPDSFWGRLKLGFNLKTGFFLLLVLALFSLPIFRVFYPEPEMGTAEELERQAQMDTAERFAGAIDQFLARAWMLARVGADWQALDADQAAAALKAALQAAEEARLETASLWGESQAAWEASLGWSVDLENANLISAQLDSSRERSWSLRQIAAEWAGTDPQRAEGILSEALKVSQEALQPYRDLDLRAIAMTWAEIDPQKGLEIIEQIADPGIKAWGLREIAALNANPAAYKLSVESARQVSDPVQRARGLWEVAAETDKTALFEEALAALQGAEGAALAYALSDLAVAWDNPALVERIAPAYPGARALALLGLGDYQTAWMVAGEIADPFERARAQATIAAAWENPAAAGEIASPILRDLALREITIKTGEVTLANEIHSAYYQVGALAGLGQYQEAAALAGDIREAYPLVPVVEALAQRDPETALALVEEMSAESDKAQALRAIALATGDQQLFERALGMALAARVRGDALAPAETSLELARAFLVQDPGKAQAAFAQAYEAAARISIK